MTASTTNGQAGPARAVGPGPSVATAMVDGQPCVVVLDGKGGRLVLPPNVALLLAAEIAAKVAAAMGPVKARAATGLYLPQR